MSSAGQQLVAGRVPGERIETSLETTDSGTFTTTETQIGTVTAALVSGRTYGISVMLRMGTTVNDSTATVRVREDSTSGTEVIGDNFALLSTGTVGNPLRIYGEYTAAATGDKTFVLTAARSGGTGTLRREAASTRPTILAVDYISG